MIDLQIITLQREDSRRPRILQCARKISDLESSRRTIADSLATIHRALSNTKMVPCRARTTLWYLSFCGYAVFAIVRMNLNITIVSMVDRRPVTIAQTSQECYPQELTNFTLQTNDTIQVPHEGFDWDEHQQAMVLGSYYWLFWITQLPGAVLAQKYGGKKIFGLMQLVTFLISFLIPISAYYSIYALILLRLAQGLVGGFVMPAMHTMAGIWIPPNERSTFVSSYLGFSVGSTVMFPLSGLIMDQLGWEWVFYMSGILGVIWFIFWHFMAFDSPSDHPRISTEEKEYIMKSLNQSVKKEKLPTPWKSIVLSPPVWIIVLGISGAGWGSFTLLTQLPTYLYLIHKMDIKSTGLMSGLPNLTRLLGGLAFARCADYLLRNKKMSRTNVRKVFAAFCLIGQGIFFLGIVVSGCDSVLVMVCFTFAAMFQGSIAAGLTPTLVDIAPNFAGISFGVSTTIGSVTGFISVAIVGVLTFNNQNVGQWQKILGLTAGITILSGIIFVLFSTAEVQQWNFPKKNKNPESSEPLEKEALVEKQETV